MYSRNKVHTNWAREIEKSILIISFLLCNSYCWLKYQKFPIITINIFTFYVAIIKLYSFRIFVKNSFIVIIRCSINKWYKLTFFRIPLILASKSLRRVISPLSKSRSIQLTRACRPQLSWCGIWFDRNFHHDIVIKVQLVNRVNIQYRQNRYLLTISCFVQLVLH